MAPANTADDAGWRVGADMLASFGHRGIDGAARQGGKSDAVGTDEASLLEVEGQGRLARRFDDQRSGPQGAQQQDRALGAVDGRYRDRQRARPEALRDEPRRDRAALRPGVD